MYEDGSPTKEYHQKYYGENIEYSDFIDDFTADNWDPEAWADFFATIGAKYVVLTGEHHDGFPLWDTHYAEHDASSRGPQRDIVRDLSEAVRDTGLKFAASYHANFNYYQPGFEGRFGHPDFNPGSPFDADAGPGKEYVEFMNAKHRELIRKYRPDLLWFDLPKADSTHARVKELIADYYNLAHEWEKDVVVNNRASTDALGHGDEPFHGDFSTPEYDTLDEISEEKWESCRGIGHSFGYNQTETKEDYLSREELVHSLVDIVSKNGNLLLNIGPKADGTIPGIQKNRLLGLGEWLDTNGAAIFGTRPWAIAEDDRSDVEVRYTWRDGNLFSTALTWPGESLTLSIPEHVSLEELSEAVLLTPSGDMEVEVSQSAEQLTITLPDESPGTNYAHTIRISEVENPRSN